MVGLGEALVGNFPGSALRAVVSKPALQQLMQQATSAGSPADAGVRHSSVGAFDFDAAVRAHLLPAELVPVWSSALAIPATRWCMTACLGSVFLQLPRS